jgi:hypothetical protein
MTSWFDLMVTCISHREAVNQLHLFGERWARPVHHRAGADNGASSRDAYALAASACVGFAGGGFSLLDKGDAVQRLSCNLHMYTSKAGSLPGCVPPVSVEDGLRRAMDV